MYPGVEIPFEADIPFYCRDIEFELKCDEYEQSEKLNVLNSIITPLKDGNLLTVSDDKKIYISKDNGLTWKLLKQEQENEIKV